MKIYGIDEKILLDVPITSSAEHEQELSKSDYVRLSWVSDKKQILPVGAYIVPFEDGLKYRLLEPYIPNQNNEIEWKYEPEFQHPLMWLSKIPFTYTTIDNSLNLSYVSQDWPYLGLTGNLLQLIIDKINNLFGLSKEDEKFSYQIIGNVDTTVNVTFSSTDIISALSAIAGACKSENVEWHLSWENKCLYFGQIAFDQGENTPILKVGENIGKVSVTNTKEGYYNVFFPQGSTRNISSRLTNGHYIASSLRLSLNFPKYADCDYPDGTIDIRSDKNEPKQILSLVFDDVYPHVDCYVYDVRSRTATLKEDGKEKLDNNGNPIKYSIWYMRLAYPLTTENADCIKKEDGTSYTTSDIEYDSNGQKKTVVHYWYDYFVDAQKDVIDGYEPCIQFVANSQPGALDQPLLGQPTATEGFEVICHQNDTTIVLDNGKKVYKGDFEIKYSQSGDVIIPTTKEDGLYPRGEKFPVLTANKAVIYNIALTDNEIKAAQDDLLQKTKAEIVRRNSDLNNYSFNSYPHIFEAQKTNLNLYIGRRVVFNDGAGFSLNTRVIKLVTKLDFPFEQEITVGNQKIKGAQSQLKEDVQTILSGNLTGNGGLNTTQVRNLIRNFGSSLFLSKTDADTAQGKITFANGAEVKNGLTSDEITNNGNITNKGSIVNSGDISNDGSIRTRNLYVTGTAHFNELSIDKVTASGGAHLFSAADGFKIIHVEEVKSNDTVTGYKLYWLAQDDDGKSIMNMWKSLDQALCMNFNAATAVAEGETSHTPVTNKYWWAAVTDVSGDKTETIQVNNVSRICNWIIVSTTNKAANCTVNPEVGDEVVQLGYRGADDPARQSAILDSSYTNTYDSGLTPPFRAYYRGINNFDLPTHRYSYFDANSAVLKGVSITQLNDTSLQLEVSSSLGYSLDLGTTSTLTCTIVDALGNDRTSIADSWSIERDSGDATADAAWQEKDKVKAFNALSQTNTVTFDIAYTAEDGDIPIDKVTNTIFSIKAYDATGTAIPAGKARKTNQVFVAQTNNSSSGGSTSDEIAALKAQINELAAKIDEAAYIEAMRKTTKVKTKS